MHRAFKRDVLFWAALPLMLPQALMLRRSAPRAPAADGPRSGRAGASTGPALRLLAMGDSPFEGVGISRIEDTLPVQLAQALAREHACPVQWQVVARNGATVRALLERWLPTVEPSPFDLILISVGVNDVLGLSRAGDFRRRLEALLGALSTHSPQAQTVVLGIPPMQAFPLLPQPLRAWLGGRSGRLDALGADSAARHGALHAPILIRPAPELFASDGFHPSALGHSHWADAVFAQLQALPWRPRSIR